MELFVGIRNKYIKLEKILKKLGRVLVAYSGGVDSTFILAAASKILGRENVLAVTAVSKTYPSSELKQAKTIAKKLEISHTIIRTFELKKPNFRNNPVNRCFYCKDELFSKLSRMAKDKNMILCDATNHSDRNDFRPGRQAAIKWKVASPLKEAKFVKSEIRDLSRKMKLPTWNVPAQACLASRFPYGTKLTKEGLRKVELAESYLKRFGISNLRVRNHGNIARIEVDSDRLSILTSQKNRTRILNYLKKLGWNYVTVDLEGYRAGSLNLF